MATNRERFEALSRQITDTRKRWDDLDAKGQLGEVSATDAALMNSRLSEWKQLKAALEAEHGIPAEDLGKPNPNSPYATLAGGAGMAPGGGGGSWAKAMTNYLDNFGAKALVPSGTVTVPSLSRGIVSSQDRPQSVLNLIPFRQLDGTDTFTYLRETVRTHAASTVERGSLKPTSVYSVAKVEDRVRTIATLSEPMDRSTLADVALLRQYLEGAMRDGVMLELEDQVINGNGSTTGVLDDMTGVLNVSGNTDQAFATSVLVTARKSVTSLENQHLDPGGFAWVLNPGDWEALELLTSDTPYVMADPGQPGSSLPIDRARRSLWGYPVVTSTVLAAGTAILGDWRGSAVIFEREGVTVDWSEGVSVGDGTMTAFQVNQVVFRAEGRWGLAITRPAAFVIADLTA